MIRSELDDAEEYAKCAVKATDSRLGDMYRTLAKAELEHANLIHEQAVRLIKEHDGTPPDGMMVVWDWEHELMIERTAKVKMLLDMGK